MQHVRSSMVTVRPAPHPHCSKSRFSSWDEVKMKSCYTAGVDKRRLLTFCLGCYSFWLQSPASVTVDFHNVLFLKKLKTLMITSVLVERSFMFPPRRSDDVRYRQSDSPPGCVTVLSCSVWRQEELIYTLFIVPAVVYSAFISMSTVSHGCYWQ